MEEIFGYNICGFVEVRKAPWAPSPWMSQVDWIRLLEMGGLISKLRSTRHSRLEIILGAITESGNLDEPFISVGWAQAMEEEWNPDMLIAHGKMSALYSGCSGMLQKVL